MWRRTASKRFWRNQAGRSINGTTQRVAAGTVIKPIGARAVGKVVNDDRADWREAWALLPGSVAYIWASRDDGRLRHPRSGHCARARRLQADLAQALRHRARHGCHQGQTQRSLTFCSTEFAAAPANRHSKTSAPASLQQAIVTAAFGLMAPDLCP